MQLDHMYIFVGSLVRKEEVADSGRVMLFQSEMPAGMGWNPAGWVPMSHLILWRKKEAH